MTLLGVIRQFFGSAVQIIVAVFTLPLVALFGRGNDQHGFLVTMALFAGISLVLILNTFVHIRERFTQAKIAHQPLKTVARVALHNRPWLLLSAVILTYWLLTAIKNQTTVYYFKYALHNQGLVSWANSFTFSSLIGVLLILQIANRHGNKHTMRLGMLIGLGGQAVIALGVYARSLWLLFPGILINSIGQGMIVGLVSIMLADTIRYGVTLGVQAEGLFASSNDFGVNLGLGIGGLITAGLFDLTGYVPNTSQNAATLAMIDLNYVWLPLLLYGILLILIHFYPEKDMLAAIRQHQA